MMDYIRTHATSWGVKIAFVIIIVVFIFWGVGSFKSTPPGTIVTVNGQSITADMFRAELDRAMENARARQPGITQAEMESQGLRPAVLREMINRILIHDEAKRAGIVVTPAELRAAITGMDTFHNENGVFDRALYEQAFAANPQMTAARYEALIRDEILESKIYAAVMGTASISEAELENYFAFAGERRSVEYVSFAAAAYQEGLVAEETQVEEVYDTYRDFWREPAVVDLQYIQLNPAELAASITPDAAAVEAYYAANLESRYQTPERVRLSHILVKVPSAAAETLAREKLGKATAELAAGKAFDQVARTYSDDDATLLMGGDLGWFARAALGPEAAALFDMPEGTISEPIQTDLGYQIFKVEERQAASTQPLEEVREEIRTALIEEEVLSRMPGLADDAQNMINMGKTLEEISTALGLPVHSTGASTRDQLAAKTGLDEKDVNMLFAVQPGTLLNYPLDSDKGFMFAFVAESLPDRVQPLDQVRELIESIVIHEESLKLAQAEAEAAREGFSGDAVPAEFAGLLSAGQPFLRNEIDAGPGLSPELVAAAFEAESIGTWLPGVYTTQDSAVIARLKSIQGPSAVERLEQMPTFRQQLLSERQNELLNLFLAQLHRGAEIREYDVSPVFPAQPQ